MPKSVRSTGSVPPAEEITPLDGDDFLAANRSNRERIRAADQPDRVPGKIVGGARWRPRLSRTRMAFIALSTLVVVLAGTTAYFAYESARPDQPNGPSEATRRQVMDLGRRYATELATYDSANYADLDRRIHAIATPSFAKTYIASSQDARRGNASAKGVSKAVSKEAGIEALSDARAVVLLTLDQTVTSPDVKAQVPQGIPYQSRVKVTLIRQNGRWLLDDFDTV